MQYIDTETNQYPLSEWEIRQANPNTSFTVPFDASPRYMPVQPTAKPTFDPLTQKVVEQAPALVDGQWVQQWSVEQMTLQEQQEAAQKLVDRYTETLTRHLDATAQQRRYDNRVTCALRAGYPGPFQAEGQAFAQWMDQCNALGYQILAEVQAGTRPMPSEAEFIAMLPPMVWPT